MRLGKRESVLSRQACKRCGKDIGYRVGFCSICASHVCIICENERRFFQGRCINCFCNNKEWGSFTIILVGLIGLILGYGFPPVAYSQARKWREILSLKCNQSILRLKRKITRYVTKQRDR